MAVSPHYVADKSALARLRYAQVSDLLSPLILAGEIATCSIIELEVLYSARSHQDLLTTQAQRALAFPLLPMTQGDFDRAAEVMEALARRGLHRSVGIPALLIAAVAERHGMTVLHYDADYEFVAAVTGQSMQWVAPRGSLP